MDVHCTCLFCDTLFLVEVSCGGPPKLRGPRWTGGVGATGQWCCNGEQWDKHSTLTRRAAVPLDVLFVRRVWQGPRAWHTRWVL